VGNVRAAAATGSAAITAAAAVVDVPVAVVGVPAAWTGFAGWGWFSFFLGFENKDLNFAFSIGRALGAVCLKIVSNLGRNIRYTSLMRDSGQKSLIT
jgi:hypothetical protein